MSISMWIFRFLAHQVSGLQGDRISAPPDRGLAPQESVGDAAAVAVVDAEPVRSNSGRELDIDNCLTSAA